MVPLAALWLAWTASVVEAPACVLEWPIDPTTSVMATRGERTMASVRARSLVACTTHDLGHAGRPPDQRVPNPRASLWILAYGW